MKTPRVWKMFADHPWSILPSTLDMMVEFMELRAAGQAFTDEEIQARIAGRPARAAARNVGAVAVLPLHGVIAPRMNMMTEVSGGTSAELFGAQLRMVMDDPDISAVILDVDSPGGSVFGVEELASTIRSMRGRKPMVAVANHLMASAAYWLASQADEIIASPSSQVGSIGVIAVHQDLSEAEAKVGVKTTLVTAGTHKADGHDGAPLSEGARASMQTMVDGYYTAFVRDVAKGRGVKATDVRNGYGEGRVVSATEAVALGMADSVGTIEQVIDRLASGSKRVSTAAEAAPARLVAEEQTRLREMLAARG